MQLVPLRLGFTKGGTVTSSEMDFTPSSTAGLGSGTSGFGMGFTRPGAPGLGSGGGGGVLGSGGGGGLGLDAFARASADEPMGDDSDEELLPSTFGQRWVATRSFPPPRVARSLSLFSLGCLVFWFFQRQRPRPAPAPGPARPALPAPTVAPTESRVHDTPGAAKTCALPVTHLLRHSPKGGRAAYITHVNPAASQVCARRRVTSPRHIHSFSSTLPTLFTPLLGGLGGFTTTHSLAHSLTFRPPFALARQPPP
jgi:hypothetical protein